MSNFVYHSVYYFCWCVTLMSLLLLKVVKVDNMYSRICHGLKSPQNRVNNRKYEDININYYFGITLENMVIFIGYLDPITIS